MHTEKEFQKIFDRLKKNFRKHAKQLNVVKDEKGEYTLEGDYSEKFKKNLWFGGVEIKKNYVSYHLMPVYMYKDLAEEVPEGLKKKMQGKSCFNFKKYDEDLFKEMEKFTGKCFKEYLKRGDGVNMKC